MQDGARFQFATFRQVHDKLHADGVIMFVMAGRHAKMFVELPANRPDRAVTDHRQSRFDVHTGREPGFGVALLIRTLIHQAHANHIVIVHDRRGDGRARPDLHRAGAHELRANPLIKLADGHDQPAVLLQVRRNVRQLERVVLAPQHAEKFVGQAQRQRPATRADRVEQVKHLFLFDRRTQRNLRRVKFREAGANPTRPRHHAGHTNADVIGTFVADDLRWRARHHGTLHFWGAVRVQQPARQRGQKPAGGRAEPNADNVHVHRLSFTHKLVLF